MDGSVHTAKPDQGQPRPSPEMKLGLPSPIKFSKKNRCFQNVMLIMYGI